MNYRNNGAIGALLDEYERAITELKAVISSISDTDLVTIVDTTTSDPDCVSIQTILTHVVGAGYNYVIAIRNSQDETLDYHTKTLESSTAIYAQQLDTMFEYNVQLFEDYPDIPLEQYQSKDKFLVPWGQLYDVEQLFEHAIVHILRHRRQIERFLLRLA